MPLLELAASDAAELEALIAKDGGEVEVVREERYFGDAQSVTMILDNSTAIINLVAATLSVWSATRAVRGAIDGRSFTLQQAEEDQVKAVLTESSTPQA